MTSEQRAVIINAALHRLAMQPPAVLQDIAPWLTPHQVMWCRQHWQDRSPEDDAAMALIREAAALLEEQRSKA